eukprot:TRINITY_DN12440_c3_g1_i1.p2 TRINITY_DN12440_c3_g1~~TRINITY_DN12440_c3_g1_i1.p2  ORF type:complete len:100 (+),score=0.33 TRINITY_DN12440_c3_g1_i1:705-1004(+)
MIGRHRVDNKVNLGMRLLECIHVFMEIMDEVSCSFLTMSCFIMIVVIIRYISIITFLIFLLSLLHFLSLMDLLVSTRASTSFICKIQVAYQQGLHLDIW